VGSLVFDANIWIDLYVGEALSLMIAFPYAIHVPDVVMAELREPNGGDLAQYGARSVAFGEERVADVYRLAARYRKLSSPDLFAMVAAQELHCPLVSGDRDLRVAAEQEGVKVFGTLWLLDELLAHRLISVAGSRDILWRMIRAGRRLPKRECEQRLLRWHIGQAR